MSATTNPKTDAMEGVTLTPPAGDAPSQTPYRYEPGEELGRGGWGAVVRARDRQLDRDVAIKRIHSELAKNPSIRTRFFNEARITAALQHPGVASVHELGVEADGAPYYVMKVLEGATLKDAIRDAHQDGRGACTIELLERFIDVCNTLACAHQQGVIHRDLKPSNIVVGRFGETVVIDWGLAKRLDSEPEEFDTGTLDATIAPTSAMATIAPPLAKPNATTRRNATNASATRHGSVLGTPAYMSPEQSRGEVDALTPATDIYALGVILYEVLTGENPFRAEDVETTLSRVRDGVYRPPREVKRGVPRQLAAICQAAMSHSPADRYASAEAIVEDIRRHLAGESIDVCPDPWWVKVDRWRRRRPGIAAAAVGSLAMLLIASIGFGFVIDRAHRAEKAARIAAEESRRQALERLADAREAGDAWLIDLSGALEFFPGMDTLRNDLLERAADHYSALSAHLHHEGKLSDAESALESARCLLRIGDLRRLLDDTSASRDAYGQAEEVLLGAAPDAAQDARLRLELVNAHIGRALLGDPIDFVGDLRWLNEETRRAADSTEVRGAMVRLTLARARMGELSGGEAIEALTAAEASAQELADEIGEQRDHQRLQIVRDELTRRLRDAGRLEQASEVWKADLSRLDRRVAEQPERPDLLQARAFARMRLAGLETRRGRVEQATPGYEQAISDLRAAWRLSDADAYYHRNVAVALANLGRSASDPTVAGVHLTEAIDQLRNAVAVEGPSADDLARLAQCEAALGDLAARTRDPQALRHYDSALQCYLLLEEHRRLDAERAVTKVGVTLSRAAHLIDLDDSIGAMADIDRAESTLDGLTDELLAGQCKRLRSRAADLRANCLRIEGDEAGARVADRESENLLREIAEHEKRSTDEGYPTGIQAYFDRLIETQTFAPEQADDAAAWLAEMRRRIPDSSRSPDWLQRSALLNRRRGRTEAAKRAAQQILLQRPYDPIAALLIAEGDEASNAADELLEQYPGDRRLRFWASELGGR